MEAYIEFYPPSKVYVHLKPSIQTLMMILLLFYTIKVSYMHSMAKLVIVHQNGDNI